MCKAIAASWRKHEKSEKALERAERKLKEVRSAMRGIELLNGAQRRVRFAEINAAISSRVTR